MQQMQMQVHWDHLNQPSCMLGFMALMSWLMAILMIRKMALRPLHHRRSMLLLCKQPHVIKIGQCMLQSHCT